jgi:hypothetical protein
MCYEGKEPFDREKATEASVARTAVKRIPHCICTTCGTQFAETARPPGRCAIFEEERPFVGCGGQAWTTLDEITRSHVNSVRLEEAGLLGIGV